MASHAKFASRAVVRIFARFVAGAVFTHTASEAVDVIGALVSLGTISRVAQTDLVALAVRILQAAPKWFTPLVQADLAL